MLADCDLNFGRRALSAVGTLIGASHVTPPFVGTSNKIVREPLARLINSEQGRILAGKQGGVCAVAVVSRRQQNRSNLSGQSDGQECVSEFLSS
jgi:hypothetical protein